MNYRAKRRFFFPKGPRKKERDPSKFDYYYYTFSATVTPRSKRVSPFRLFGLFFSFRLSFSSFDNFCVKEAAPFEREQRERTSSPSFLVYFPHNKKSSQNTTTASEDVIYIYILTHTRVTQNTSQYSTTHDERRRQDEIFKVLRAVERRTRAR